MAGQSPRSAPEAVSRVEVRAVVGTSGSLRRLVSRSWLAVLEGLAALGVGALAGWIVFRPEFVFVAGHYQRDLGMAAEVAVIAVAVAAGPVLARLLGRAGRWAVAGVGVLAAWLLLLAAGLLLPAPVHVTLLPLVAGLLAGVPLGGVLVALVTAPGPSRVAIALGLGCGLPLLSGALPLGEALTDGGVDPGGVVFVAGSALAVAAAVTVAITERSWRRTRPERTLRLLWPVGLIAGAAAAALLLDALLRRWEATLGSSPGPGFLTQMWGSGRGVRTMAAVVVLTVLVVLARRRVGGSVTLAAWTGLAACVPLLVGAAPTWQFTVPVAWLLAATIAGGVGTGVVLNRLWAPPAGWEVPGLAAVATALLLVAEAAEPVGVPAVYEPLAWSWFALAGGLGFTLGAVLGRIAARPAVALPADTAVAVAVGVGGALAVSNLLARVAYFSTVSPGDLHTTGAVLVGGIALVLAALGIRDAQERRDDRPRAAMAG